MPLTFLVSCKGCGENLHGVKINVFSLVMSVLYSSSLVSSLPSLRVPTPTPHPVQSCLLAVTGAWYEGDNDKVQT